MKNTLLTRGGCGVFLFLLMACNSDVPVSAHVDFSADRVRVTIVRVATHPFLLRHDLRLTFEGPGGCVSEAELFPDTGYVSRRNLYQAGVGVLYVVGQFDVRVIDVSHCTITLAEFRALDPYVTFLGSFQENSQKQWAYFSARQLAEFPFEKR